MPKRRVGKKPKTVRSKMEKFSKAGCEKPNPYIAPKLSPAVEKLLDAILGRTRR